MKTVNRNRCFIIGAPRSGTTVLRLALNAHSKLCLPEEVIFFSKAVFPRGIKMWRSCEVPMPVIDGFIRHLSSRMPEVTIDKVWAAIKHCETPDPCSIYSCVMDLLANQAGKFLWGEKTPGNAFYVDVLREMFPAAKFIFVERDPRAIVASMNRAPFYSADTAINAMNLKHYLRAMKKAKSIVPQESRIELRYEQFVQTPESSLRDVCRFLKFTFESQMLDYHRDAGKNMQPTALADFNRRATEPLDPTNADRWRDKLTRREIQIIERVLGSEMVSGGYKTEGIASLPLLERFYLLARQAYWLVNRVRHFNDRSFQQRDILLFRTRKRLAKLGRKVGIDLNIPHPRGRTVGEVSASEIECARLI
jgi:hypothetical protein